MKLPKIIKVMVLLLFLGHYGNITLFYHTHTVEGITYTHSHFYGFEKSANPTQLPHTNNQLQLIQELNQITWHSDISITAVESPYYQLLSEFLCPDLQHNSLFAPIFNSLRAPPSIVASYDWRINGIAAQLSGGVKNLFNSYQTDLDRGAFRDAGYVYGPSQPRSFYVGVKFSN